MIKYVKCLAFLLLSLFSQSVFAISGLLFDVTSSGASANVSISLCLDGPEIISCQDYTVSALNLMIRPTINHYYPAIGIKINTPGYTVANLGIDCTSFGNGYCGFGASQTTPKSITLTTGSVITLSITPSSLPAALTTTAYTQTIVASGGSAPYTYLVTAGALPSGLSLNASTGVLAGTPLANGTYNFTVTATDAKSNTASVVYSLVVTGPVTLTVSPSTLPAGGLNAAYSQTITASGGTPPYTYAVISGSLPTGLSFNGGTGVLSGTPSSNQGSSSNITIRATDSASNTGSQAYTLVINSPCGVGNAATLTAATSQPISFTGTGFISVLGYTGASTSVNVCENLTNSCVSPSWLYIGAVPVTSVSNTNITSGNAYGATCKSLCNVAGTSCTNGILST